MSSYISKCYDANECKQFISRLFLNCINAPELTDLDSILYARHHVANMEQQVFTTNQK